MLTYNEYSKLKHEIPYKLVIKSNDNYLYYFGERHSFDPKDSQFDVVLDFWNDFIIKTEGKKRIVFVEGGLRPVETDRDFSILNHGGMGYVTHLANKVDIQTYSPEPDEAYERNELEKKFTKDQIQYYYFARVVYQWVRKQEPKPLFEKYIGKFLEMDKLRSGWVDYDFSLENMIRIHEELFKVRFDKNDTDLFYSIVNPVIINHVINDVSANSGYVRDEYIVKMIKQYIEVGYSIFAEYGCSHVVMQEPLLRKVL